MDKENVYDADISPLMEQIIAICKQHGIAMFATFSIPNEGDPDLFCTSMTPDENGKQRAEIMAAYRILRPSPMMLTTLGADGEVKSMTAILP